MGARTYEKLKDKLRNELDEVAKKDNMSAGDLEMTHKLTDTIKNIYKIEKLEGEMGFSGGSWYGEGDSGRGGSRAGTHYVGGYYSHDGGGDYSGGHYRRTGGRYSMDDGREMFGREMRGIMSNEAYDPMERESMRNAYRNMY